VRLPVDLATAPEPDGHPRFWQVCPPSGRERRRRTLFLAPRERGLKGKYARRLNCPNCLSLRAFLRVSKSARNAIFLITVRFLQSPDIVLCADLR